MLLLEFRRSRNGFDLAFTSRSRGGRSGTRNPFARRQGRHHHPHRRPPGYNIAVDGKPVLVRSYLALELADNVKLGEEPVVQGEERESADNHWENLYGKNRDMRDHYNERRFP
ncbi:MAG: glycoside hydrolase family 97 N-terminal domain-containing protein [Thermoguttaceae bacterium]